MSRACLSASLLISAQSDKHDLRLEVSTRLTHLFAISSLTHAHIELRMIEKVNQTKSPNDKSRIDLTCVRPIRAISKPMKPTCTQRKMLQIAVPTSDRLPDAKEVVLPAGMFPYCARQLDNAELCLTAATAKKANVTTMVINVSKKLILMYILYSVVDSFLIVKIPKNCQKSDRIARMKTMNLGHPAGIASTVATIGGGLKVSIAVANAMKTNSAQMV